MYLAFQDVASKHAWWPKLDNLLFLFLHTGENTPPYYYGTHYSSAMIVASYLIRMEPFTQHFLKLQVELEELIVLCSLSLACLVSYI